MGMIEFNSACRVSRIYPYFSYLQGRVKFPTGGKSPRAKRLELSMVQ